MTTRHPCQDCDKPKDAGSFIPLIFDGPPPPNAPRNPVTGQRRVMAVRPALAKTIEKRKRLSLTKRLFGLIINRKG